MTKMVTEIFLLATKNMSIVPLWKSMMIIKNNDNDNKSRIKTTIKILTVKNTYSISSKTWTFNLFPLTKNKSCNLMQVFNQNQQKDYIALC